MNPEASYMVSTSQIFTIFFIMFGPLRLLVPFAELGQQLNLKQRSTLALKACGIAALAVVLGCLMGKILLFNWHLEIPVLMIAAGLVFFLSGIVPMVFPAAVPHGQVKISDPRSVAFHMIITPYGMGAAIVLLAMSQSMDRNLVILGCFLGVIILDLIAMIFSASILKYTSRIVLPIINVSLGILGIALGLEIIVKAMRFL